MRVAVAENPTNVTVAYDANSIIVETNNIVTVQSVGIQGSSGSAMAIGGTVSGFTGNALLFTDGAGALAQSLDLYFDPASANLVVGGGAFNSISYFIGEVDFYDSSAIRTLASSSGVGGIFINPDASTSCNLRAYGSNLSNLIFMYPFGDTISFGQAADLGGTVGIQAWTTTDTSLVIQAIGAQTGNLLSFKNAAGTTVFGVNSGGDIDHDGSAVGFLGATPAAKQTGGVATAGASYTATEQNMIQKAYNALRTFGFLT